MKRGFIIRETLQSFDKTFVPFDSLNLVSTQSLNENGIFPIKRSNLKTISGLLAFENYVDQAFLENLNNKDVAFGTFYSKLKTESKERSRYVRSVLDRDERISIFRSLDVISLKANPNFCPGVGSFDDPARYTYLSKNGFIDEKDLNRMKVLLKMKLKTSKRLQKLSESQKLFDFFQKDFYLSYKPSSFQLIMSPSFVEILQKTYQREVKKK